MLVIYKDSSFEETEIAPRPAIIPIYDSDQEFYLRNDYFLCFTFIDEDGVVHKVEIFIPALFIFDGASIPRFFWRVVGFPLSPRFIVAALIHDALFGKIHGRVKIWLNGEELSSDQAQEFFDQKTTDLIFKGILIVEQNSGWKVRAMHRAVRMGGRFSFRKTENKFYRNLNHA
jgi:hypothetical protein